MSSIVVGPPAEIARSPFPLWPAGLSIKSGLLQRAWARHRTRRIVSQLSEEQRRDAGIDEAALFGNRPVSEVPRDLLNRLNLMR